MNQPTSIIVYRNPLEAAGWNNLMSGDIQFIPIVLGAAVCVGLIILLNLLATKIYGFRMPNWIQYIIFILGGLGWIGTYSFLAI